MRENVTWAHQKKHSLPIRNVWIGFLIGWHAILYRFGVRGLWWCLLSITSLNQPASLRAVCSQKPLLIFDLNHLRTDSEEAQNNVSLSQSPDIIFYLRLHLFKGSSVSSCDLCQLRYGSRRRKPHQITPCLSDRKSAWAQDFTYSPVGIHLFLSSALTCRIHLRYWEIYTAAKEYHLRALNWITVMQSLVNYLPNNAPHSLVCEKDGTFKYMEELTSFYETDER